MASPLIPCNFACMKQVQEADTSLLNPDTETAQQRVETTVDSHVSSYAEAILYDALNQADLMCASLSDLKNNVLRKLLPYHCYDYSLNNSYMSLNCLGWWSTNDTH